MHLTAAEAPVPVPVEGYHWTACAVIALVAGAQAFMPAAPLVAVSSRFAASAKARARIYGSCMSVEAHA
eukprot:6602-Heterococcus_DN1.PRE.1